MGEANLRFFPSDTNLQYVEDVSLTLDTCTQEGRMGDFKDLCDRVVNTILHRLLRVTNVSLWLPGYARLTHYVREYPSIRSLSFMCMASPLETAGLNEFLL